MSVATKLELPPLPFAEDALEPVISARTVNFHYHKHHKGYVDKTNKLIAGTKYAEMDLDEIVRESCGHDKEIFHNAAQAWNHNFYWKSVWPEDGMPKGKLAEAIEEFGGLEALKKEMASQGEKLFGSGWVWLVMKNGKLAVEKTPDADTPFAKGTKCLLCVDVWEHAYYLDYQNDRDKHLKSVLDRLINWKFAADNLSK